MSIMCEVVIRPHMLVDMSEAYAVDVSIDTRLDAKTVAMLIDDELLVNVA